jgi:hypothetical protein
MSMPQPGNRLAWLLGRGNVESERESFFVWQERVLDVLLAWGAGNVLAGTAIALTRSGTRRAIAVQAIGWGAVDASIAIYAQCVARKHATSARAGMYGARHVQDRARQFGQLLAVQTGADVVYVVAGSVVAAKSKRPWVRGTALGVVIQGGALLLYDLALSIRMLTRPELRFREVADA